MKNITAFKCFRLITLMLVLVTVLNVAFAQLEYQPYSFQYNQGINKYLYSAKTKEHTVLKPFFVGDSSLKGNFDSLFRGNHLFWKSGRFYNEHLIESNKKNSSFYADVLPEFTRSVGGQTTNVNSLGVQFGGSLSNKFSYYGSLFETNQTFADYQSTYIHQTGIIPGQSSKQDSTGSNNYSWNYIAALVSYTPNKYLNLSAGRDKNFIGDGYRSLLLSDYSSPYLFFKLTASLGSLRYMCMWSYMNDPASTSQYGINRKKFGVFHFIDWNVNNRISLGLFENVIGFYTDDNGVKRPFDFYYINPLIVLKPINNSSNDPDKSLLGFTGKYKLSSHLTYYCQFALNEFNSRHLFPDDGSYTNKYAYQFGLRGTDLLKIKGLNFLVESNTVKPFTYSARSAIENYSNNGEPLAHPWGANFKEVVCLLNYQHKRWTFNFEANYGKYGLDTNNLDFGKDIFIVYSRHTKDLGNTIGQGLSTTMLYLEAKAALILNPLYNLRLELSFLSRSDKNSQFDDKTSLFSIGLKSSFRNFYSDIVSYKTH